MNMGGKYIFTRAFIILILCLSISNAIYPDPTSGIYKIEIKYGWNLISLPMQTIQRTQGKVTSLGANTITDSTKSWVVNAYQNDILLIKSGSGEGYYYKISSNTLNTLTLSSSLSSSIATGAYFYIYEAYTLTEIFGDYSSGPLYAASNKNAADEIYLWDRSTQAFSTSIWLCNSVGNEGWWQGSTQITDNSVTLIPNEACFVVRKPASIATLNYVGIVPDTKQTLNIKSGDNIVGESFPAAVTMSDSGLGSTLQSGVSSYIADNIFKWSYSDQKFGLATWYSSYPGYTNWYQGSSNVNSTYLNPAEGFMIKNRSTEKNWQRTKPYTSP